MAKSATLGEAFLLLLAGRKFAREQHSFLVRQSQQAGKRERAASNFGRPYQSQMRADALETLTVLRVLRRAAAVAAKPFRMVASLGEYDANKTL